MPQEPPPQLTFRPATPRDIPALVELINSAFAIETFIDGTRTNAEQLAAMIEKGTILLAQSGAPTGPILASVYTELRGNRGYLGQLAVAPAHQGSGLARRLVLQAEQAFRRQGCEAIDITVLSLRPELPPIYRRFGYVESGTEPFHPHAPLAIGQQCHCIVMTKRLVSSA
jgi:predicted N-acetyltransferase YhbS